MPRWIAEPEGAMARKVRHLRGVPSLLLTVHLPPHNPCCRHSGAQTWPCGFLWDTPKEAIPSLRDAQILPLQTRGISAHMSGSHRSPLRPYSAHRGYIRPSSHQPRQHKGKAMWMRGTPRVLVSDIHPVGILARIW